MRLNLWVYVFCLFFDDNVGLRLIGGNEMIYFVWMYRIGRDLVGFKLKAVICFCNCSVLYGI